MILVKITNKTSASMSIEDIGVTLQRSGGNDSSCIITENQYNNSRDIKNYSGWIHVEYLYPKHVTERLRVKNEEIDKIIVNPPVITNSISQEISFLQSSIRSMDEKISQMTDLLLKQSQIMNDYVGMKDSDILQIALKQLKKKK